MNVSYQLISQHFTKNLVIRALDYLENYLGLQYNTYFLRYQDLRVELWYNCIWTNYGIISYRNYAEFILLYTQGKAEQLPVKKISDRLYLVKGKVKDWYAVHDNKCECMLYRLRKNRASELPQFFKHLPNNGLFCHHLACIF